MGKIIDKTKVIRVFETFAGIGAQHKALNKISWIKPKIVCMSEWYISAIIAYYKIHGKSKLTKLSKDKILKKLSKLTLSRDSKTPIKKLSSLSEKELQLIYTSIKEFNNLGSIMDIKGKDIPKHDLLTYSFPCQDISIAGYRNGFSKNSGTQSSLVWEVERILQELKVVNKLPKYLMMENVSAITNKNNIEGLNIFKSHLSKLGFSHHVELILNASNFGIPQNRKRYFFISSTSPLPTKQLKALESNSQKLKFTIRDIISTNMTTKNIEKKYLKAVIKKYNGKENIEYNKIIKRVGAYPKHGQSDVLVGVNAHIVPTVTFSNETSRQKVIMKDENGEPIVRRFVGEQNLRLMGFSTKDYLKIKEVIDSEQKISSLAGNSIVVDVLEEIFKVLFK